VKISFTGKIGSNRIVVAVMDGLFMGIDSYFVSTLVGQIIRKVCLQFDYIEFHKKDPEKLGIEEYLKAIVKDCLKNSGNGNQLMLEKRELLTTLVILLIDMLDNKVLYWPLVTG